MASQSGAGIQELMAAETRASQIVAEARMGESLSEDFCGGNEMRQRCRTSIEFDHDTAD
jgi:hypothetical protein